MMPRFCDCVEQMTGRRPNIFWFLCWKYFAPAVMFVSQLLHKLVFHRRSRKTEEKAKVVAAVWGTEFIQFLDAPAVLH